MMVPCAIFYGQIQKVWDLLLPLLFTYIYHSWCYASVKRGWELQFSLAYPISSQLSCNSCSRLTGASELKKLSCTLAYRLSSTLVLVWLGHESCKTLMQTLASQFSSTLVLVWPGHESWKNSHTPTLASQLSCNSCSRLTRAWELRKLSCKLSLLNSHQSHATLVLVSVNTKL
jgi:hypothetical protein